MIEMYLLEHLVAVRKSKSLSEAAESLYLTQPSLSRSMKKLEEEFGVPLFDHDKKRLTLNENGLLAAEYAENILELHNRMLNEVHARDRRSRTITLGTCAPGPIMELFPLLTGTYSQQTLTSVMRTEAELLEGLQTHEFQLIILTKPPHGTAYYYHKCGSEQLYASLTPEHKFAYEKEIAFADMDGESFLMAAEVGIWGDIVRKKMPNARFLLQNSVESLTEVAGSSSLPGFATDLTLRILGRMNQRLFVPFSDPEAYMDFYCVCLSSDKQKFSRWFDLLERRF
jgi:DNA-binding transcriptional LysR family regulator